MIFIDVTDFFHCIVYWLNYSCHSNVEFHFFCRLICSTFVYIYFFLNTEVFISFTYIYTCALL